jgi:phosphoglycerate dehydrogenase-like enzyme
MHFVCPDGEPQYRDQVAGHVARILEAQGHTFAWHEGRPADDDEFVARLAGADGALVLFTVPTDVLRRAEQLAVISWHGTGVQQFIDVPFAARHGVTVCNVRDYGANAVAEHTFALAFAVARNIAGGDRLIRSGAWGQREGVELGGRILGVVGAGPIAHRVIEIGRAFGMQVQAWTRSPSPERAARLGVRFVDLDELFSSSDVVTVNVAHTPQTEGLVDARLLALLRPAAILVNTARAEIVDTAALDEALAQGRILGAGVDVFAQEPIPAGTALPDAERSVLSPHVGYYTGPANDELFRVAVANLAAYASGEPTNVVEPGLEAVRG